MTGCYHRTNPSTREERWGNVRTAHHESGGCHRESVRVGVDELVTRADAVSEQVAFVGQAGGLADECGGDLGPDHRADLRRRPRLPGRSLLRSSSALCPGDPEADGGAAG